MVVARGTWLTRSDHPQKDQTDDHKFAMVHSATEGETSSTRRISRNISIHAGGGLAPFIG